MLLQQNYSKSYIARVIGKHRSVVSKEIKRNVCAKTGKYNYKKALFQK